ncbi:MAG: T9SS type A sorting domain-containing protein [Bacteroidetes bacterium]|nr:T9SS type A sorting domain-containing protein [Bacteroidota bacterium]
MKQFIIILIAALSIAACNPEIEQVPLVKADDFRDSLLTKMDSLILKDIKLPQIRNFLQFDSATISVFQTLADSTNGKMYLAENASLVVQSVIEIIENHGGDDIDLCFLIDKTGSMTDDIFMLQNSMDLIFSAIKKYKNVNVALVYYGDKNVDGASWIDINDFSKDFNKLESNFKKVRYSGGGDTPESMTDGAHKAIESLSWSSNVKRIMLVLGDAPSLEPPLAKYSIKDIIAQARLNNIQSNYYPVVVGFAGEIVGPVKTELIENIYPNPVSSILNVVLANEEEYNLEIFNGSGVLIKTEKFKGVKYQQDVSEMADGVYVLRVSKPDGSLVDSQKFVVKK